MAPPIRIQIENVKKGLNTGISEEVGSVAFASFAAIVFASPVKLGHFRGNWQVAVNSPKKEELEVTDKSGQPTVAAASKFFATYEMEAGSKTNKIFFSNNVPYALRLNEGHSQQAKSGFVEKALRAGLKALGAKGKII